MCWRLQQVPAERLRRNFAALWVFHVAEEPVESLEVSTGIVERSER